jgi:hypothetical protein
LIPQPILLKEKSGAFGKKGIKEIEYDYLDVHGRRSKRTGKVEKRTTKVGY